MKNSLLLMLLSTAIIAQSAPANNGGSEVYEPSNSNVAAYEEMELEELDEKIARMTFHIHSTPDEYNVTPAVTELEVYPDPEVPKVAPEPASEPPEGASANGEFMSGCG